MGKEADIKTIAIEGFAEKERLLMAEIISLI